MLIGGIVMWFMDARMTQVGGGGRGSAGEFDSHVAHGSDEFGASGVDRGVPDFVGGVSGDLAVDVDHRGGQVAGMSRASALEFSFFLSMPTMAMATLYTLLNRCMEQDGKPDRGG